MKTFINILLIITALTVLVVKPAQSLDEAAFLKEANDLYKTGDYNEAIEVYQKVLKVNPDSYIANYDIGLALYHTKEYEKAVKHFEKASLSDSNIVERDSFFLLGNTYYRMSEGKEDEFMKEGKKDRDKLRESLKLCEESVRYFAFAGEDDSSFIPAKNNYGMAMKRAELLKERLEKMEPPPQPSVGAGGGAAGGGAAGGGAAGSGGAGGGAAGGGVAGGGALGTGGGAAGGGAAGGGAAGGGATGGGAASAGAAGGDAAGGVAGGTAGEGVAGGSAAGGAAAEGGVAGGGAISATAGAAGGGSVSGGAAGVGIAGGEAGGAGIAGGGTAGGGTAGGGAAGAGAAGGGVAEGGAAGAALGAAGSGAGGSGAESRGAMSEQTALMIIDAYWDGEAPKEIIKIDQPHEYRKVLKDW